MTTDSSARLGSASHPLVSVVIPTLNEELHIESCLRSVQRQTYSPDLVEIIVADGGSSDATRDIVERLAAEDPRIRLIDNPGRNQAAGLNLAIAASKGGVIARLDGHAEWRPGHLERCLQLLEETGADNVGGTMQGHGDNAVELAIAAATRSPFAVGGATYRYSSKQQDVETVWLGCFRRDALDRVGGFDEKAPPHEDYELNHRIRAAGGRVVYSPDLQTLYWPRSSWRALAKQYYRYGRAKVRVAVRTPEVIRIYHLAPPALVAGTVLGTGLIGRTGPARRAALALAGSYALASLAAAVAASRGQPNAVRLRTALVFPIVHVSWGLGFWAGVAEALRDGLTTIPHA
ncbi:MAG TPA: glycosyltransferase family 2 protein [Candidatus Solibacter sp.]|jgi:succinoglycan biosynthesis protein ExoA|nr:glycosyltransferase family 2 protein [Candidatus Solibacter sp.]